MVLTTATTSGWLKNHHDEHSIEMQSNITKYVQHAQKLNHGYSSEYFHPYTDYLMNFTTVAGILSDDNETRYHVTQHSVNSTLDNLDLDAICNSEDGIFNKYFQTFVNIMYIVIFLMAVIGNGIVCFIVQSSPRMRTVTNFFIANLAVGDMLMALFCIPFSSISLFVLNYWPFGEILCRFVNYSQAVSVLVSAYTLVAISLDRYIAIMWPLRPRITKR